MTQQINNQKEQPRWKFVAAVFTCTVAMKLLPYVLTWFGFSVEKAFSSYPWGFSPIFALSIFGTAISQHKNLAILSPLAIWFVGDLGIWAVTGHFGWAFYPEQIVVYAAFAFCAVLGFLLRDKRSWGRVATAGVVSCLTFFVITNFASWVGSTTYPQNLEGLMLSYEAGLPFLRNSLVATAIFGGLLFSPVCLRQTAPAEASPEMLAANAG